MREKAEVSPGRLIGADLFASGVGTTHAAAPRGLNARHDEIGLRAIGSVRRFGGHA